MRFTDIFIKRPVLASVISILILVFGARALMTLQVREFPKMENTVINITTSYPGASAQLMQGFVTTPLEKSIASADGIDYITATSNQNVSQISAHIKLNYDPETALTNIMGKVAAVRYLLPRNVNDPVVTKETGNQMALMYIGFYSKGMSGEQITDYLTRVVQPKLETVGGVAKAEILGGKTFAMRVWLNPNKMAALHITATQVQQALTANNFQAPAGQTKGKYVIFNLNAETDLHKIQQFKDIVIKNDNGTLIRMKDIASIKLGSESYDSSVRFNGKGAVFIGIYGTPSANPLTVISQIRKLFPKVQAEFPSSLKGKVVYDSTTYIRASIHEVLTTLLEATLIVMLVIFCFLGAFRTMAIPMLTIPLSLIGAGSIMLALGFSINILTLLAMVLAIGLVVDDAIIVVENIYRHIEAGESPREAALAGAREIAAPVISMTITLAAVFAPIGLMGGLTGALFTEFAFTLAGTVIISGVIALTLSPMLCSRILSHDLATKPLVKKVDRTFEIIKNFYQRRLHSTLQYRPVVFVFALIIVVSIFFLFSTTQKELAPKEDLSAIWVMAQAPNYANLDYLEKYTDQLTKVYDSFPETQDSFLINGAENINMAISGMILKPWNERSKTAAEVQPLVQKKLNSIAGLRLFAVLPPALPGTGGGPPIKFVLTTTAGYKTINQAAEKIAHAAQTSGIFEYAAADLKFNRPQLEINVNRDKAAELGITMQQIGTALSTFLGGNYVNLFSMQGRSYQVIPQVQRRFRWNPNELKYYHIRTASGDMVPLTSVVKLSYSIQPNSLTQFQQLNSTTIEGMMMPGQTIADGLAYLRKAAAKYMPKDMSYDYAGAARQYVQEGNKLMYTFFFSILIIFLVLAAQFESFRDPVIIMFSVPMSICGALIALNVGLATLNIYTEIGLVTLIGLISKHGILMVQFANQLQIEEGLSVYAAIEKSATLRLRPVLMTTLAMVFGVFPLVFASGAGAVSRYNMGLVIAVGMTIGTLFTLFVVPTMYTYFAKDRNAIKDEQKAIQTSVNCSEPDS